ncbi:WD repeat-containing protein, putative [Entamoeba invadens IP1]|uniref:WD repeat-containing protein, putative n=1 Tax=Entamoeba invadens IP1 TaxID=370355 RepID=UPI0002C3D848|nr:WD repeat-containing protein, putative [Entamoeba invadens IP1]ELP93202.1 WD repeat-containing protein, putative [Entamoeba invadens IP1]|eukprot:XP_004259973.1 WD repeat-containing protein, putative [Entamoeba invadens IP1]
MADNTPIVFDNTLVVPDDLKHTEFISDFCFSPTNDIVGLGDMKGRVSLYKYGDLTVPEMLFEIEGNKDSVRNVCFNEGGNLLFSTSSDGAISIVDINAQKVLATNPRAHKHPIYALDSKGDMIVTGDEDGCIKVWDMRQQKCVAVHDEHNDYISQVVLCGDTIFAAGGDGCMSTWSLKKGKVIGISQNLNESLLSLTVLEEDYRICCGSERGKVYVWSWDDWEEPKLKLSGHPDCVQSLITIDRNTVFSGSFDGVIRIVQITPNKLLGCVGKHEFPVEKMQVSRDKRFLGSCSLKKHVKFWDVGYLYDDADESTTTVQVKKPEQDIVTDYQEVSMSNEYKKRGKKKKGMQQNPNNPFFKGMED